MNIENKVILITGSAKRVGKEIAIAFARKNARVCIHYNQDETAARETLAEISGFNTDAMILQADIRQREDWLKMKEAILNKWGKIDVLVNNAAIFYKTPIFEANDEQWQDFMDTNLKSAYMGSQIFGELMYQQKSGKIINIADVSAEKIWPSYIPYCISKAGVVALTKGLAKALAPHVAVNAVSPGTVLLAEEYDAEEENTLIEKTPMKRVGQPEDIANSVVFLVEGSDFITGEILKVDGGRSLA